MKTEKAKTFLKDNRDRLVGAAIMTTAVAGVFYLGHASGASAVTKQTAKLVEEGATFNHLVSLARSTEAPIKFLWKFEDLEDYSKIAIELVK